MKPHEVKSNDDVRSLFEDREVEFVHVAMVDNLALFKGK